MAIDFDADLDILLNPNEFGQPAVLGEDSSAVNINVIFDTSFTTIDGFDYAEQSTNLPVLTCKTQDILSFKKGDKVTTGGLAYTIREIQQKEFGLSQIFLYRF
ncbi:MAG: hypothetical protein AAGI66_09010 [Cyanobacteria bacterium P01_H01_bin.74]